jgi:hypothetical protein
MEIAAKYTIRYEEAAGLHEGCFNRYAQLQSKYDIKHIEMIEYKTKAN